MKIFLTSISLFIISACTFSTEQKELPFIGDRTDLTGNKIEHTIRPFTFASQLGETITNKDLDNKIHVVDFFFTSCPSICPLVTAQI